MKMARCSSTSATANSLSSMRFRTARCSPPQVVSAVGSGHGALAGFLRQYGVDVLICGGIGGGARTALADAGIQLYPGASGDADKQVADLLAGQLAFDPDTQCSHHHGEDHDCGSHSCGEDKHGCAGNH